MRRRDNTKAPKFDLGLPSAVGPGALSVPMEGVRNPTGGQLFIDLDSNVDSPFMTTSVEQFPTVPGSTKSVPNSMSSDTMPEHSNSRHFFQVDGSDLFVFVDPSMAEASVTAGGVFGTEFSSADCETLQSFMDQSKGIPYEELEFGEFLGAGQQGTVRACTHKGKHYALKIISVASALDSCQSEVERHAQKASIVRELRIVAQRHLQCSYVVRMFNAYYKNMEVLILMERMSISLETFKNHVAKLPFAEVKKHIQRCFGNHLSGVAVATPQMTIANVVESADKRTTPVPEIIISLIAHDVLEGLVHLHQKLRVVHTDIKPSNILFGEHEAEVKIADFGCNLELGGDSFVKATGVTLGSQLYKSPERVANNADGADRFGCPADVWALGITLLELADGCHPCEQLKSKYWDFAERLRLENLLLPVACSAAFYDFIARLLCVDPAERATAEGLLQHDFIIKYGKVPRQKLAAFVSTVRREALQYDRMMCRKAMEHRLKNAALTQDRDFKKKSVKIWSNYNRALINKAPNTADPESFPALS